MQSTPNTVTPFTVIHQISFPSSSSKIPFLQSHLNKKNWPNPCNRYFAKELSRLSHSIFLCIVDDDLPTCGDLTDADICKNVMSVDDNNQCERGK